MSDWLDAMLLACWRGRTVGRHRKNVMIREELTYIHAQMVNFDR